jgi:MerR family transcriptional regulator, redox-sensitive transcriptional activator SoxR
MGMQELSIGQVARRSGLTASALRYYEKAGLLRAPARKSRQRRYDESVFGRIQIIQLALAAGFTIRETHIFLSGFSETTPPAARWRVLATRKLDEVKTLMARAQQMQQLLESGFQCRCLRIEDCEKYLVDAQCKPSQHKKGP